MNLTELASLLLTSNVAGDGHIDIFGLETDSRAVKPGDLFICLPGFKVDGHHFVAEAVSKGAVAIVAEQQIETAVPVVYVKNSRYAMAVMASHFYGYPSNKMKVIGVTGTNGKTTITFLLDRILTDHGCRTGLMGTIVMKIGESISEAHRTTQEALDLQKHMRAMVDAQTDYCIMEVSSHALEQGRVKGCDFHTAIFTNLTQDHLDYHLTMENYKMAKGLFFARMGNAFYPDRSLNHYAILNADDAASAYFSSLTAAQVLTYGIDNSADVQASELMMSSKGTEFLVTSFAGSMRFHLKMVGKFNIYNALAAVAAALAEGIPLAHVKESLERVTGVDGRVEVVDEGQDYLVVVDYAHTPDGLDNILSALKEFAKARIITIFGCGGDRDRTKRPMMGEIAARYSDYVYVTSDNPRSEDPEAILQDIVPGIVKGGLEESSYELDADRKSAIQKAIVRASSNDIILIAGKGHETYQTIKGTDSFFDDRLEARQAIRGIRK